MFKKLFNNESATITSAAVIIGITSLTSRILGIFRDRILAGAFGAGQELDMYYVAFRLPDLVYNLLVLGALSAGFIPIFVGYINSKENNKEAWQLANNILNILAVALIVLCGVAILLSPWLVKIIAPGFSSEQQFITAKLVRIMLISPIFLGISSVFGGILQSFKRFFVYSLAPIFYNLGIILGALFFYDWWGLSGLAIGVILGAFFHLLIQLPASFNLGYTYQWIFDLSHIGLKKIFKMTVPRLLTLATTQINLLAITIIASTLAAGSLTVFNFASNLQSFPVGIFGISFAIAAFPSLAQFAASGRKEEFIANFSSASRQILFFTIPALALLLVLRAQAVRLVFGGVHFTWENTILTMNTLTFLSLSLFSDSLVYLLIRAFYAYQDSKTPFYIGLFSAIINIIASLTLAKKFGVIGLAVAYCLASYIDLTLLFLLLRKKLKRLDGRKIINSFLKICIAAIIAGAVAQNYKFIIEPISGTATFFGLLTQAAIAGSIGILVYVAVCFALSSPELETLAAGLKRKLLAFKKLPAVNVGEDEDINVG